MDGTNIMSECLDNFRTNLKRLRAAAGWSQKYVAERLGIKQPTYANVENCHTDVQLSTICALAKLFQVQIDDLLGEPDPPPRRKRGA
jgi:transcriptional regulator with XRE-family HTH domain